VELVARLGTCVFVIVFSLFSSALLASTQRLLLRIAN
jgi:hypothetical protein